MEEIVLYVRADNERVNEKRKAETAESAKNTARARLAIRESVGNLETVFISSIDTSFPVRSSKRDKGRRARVSQARRKSRSHHLFYFYACRIFDIIHDREVMKKMSSVITINKPMVLVPADEYLMLLKESGEKPPKGLLREIKSARKELKSGKSISWGALKNEFGI